MSFVHAPIDYPYLDDLDDNECQDCLGTGEGMGDSACPSCNGSGDRKKVLERDYDILDLLGYAP